MKKVTLDTLRQLLDKLIYDHLNPYYINHGRLPFKDGLILLRTNFYEPLLNENFSREYYNIFKEYFEKNLKRNEEHYTPAPRSVSLYEKLIIILHQGTRPPKEQINKEAPIFAAHQNYLNDAIHNNPNVTTSDFVKCYITLQNFTIQILKISDPSDTFSSEQEIVQYLDEQVRKIQTLQANSSNEKLLDLEKEVNSKEEEIKEFNQMIKELQWQKAEHQKDFEKLRETLAAKEKECERLKIELLYEKAKFELAKHHRLNEKGNLDTDIKLIEQQIFQLERQLNQR